MLTNKR